VRPESEELQIRHTSGQRWCNSQLFEPVVAAEPTVHIVDDDAVSRRILQSLLKKQGYEVEVAANGREALDAIQKHTFDMVILDIQMPELDGFEVAAAIRDLEKKTGRYTPIMALTAHALVGQQQECLSRGIDGFATKPIQPRKLLQTLVSLAPLVSRVGSQ